MSHVPYVVCEHCRRSVRSKDFEAHAARYCQARVRPMPSDERKRESERRDLAAAIRNRP